MRFSVQLPVDRVDEGPEFVSAEAIGEMARAIERAGFDACFVTEHPFPPDGWLRHGGHHALDPFVALSIVAAATRTLRLHTNILVLAYRNPFMAAKGISSLDVASDGRVIVGVGAGYLQGEFRALGAEFDGRNDRFDEALVAMKAAWTGESVELSSGTWQVEGNTMRPPPIQRPHPPIWIGGNSPRAIRRAVDHAQGWSPFPLPRAATRHTRTLAIESIDDLKAGIKRMERIAEQCGRSAPLDVNFVPFGLGMNASAIPEHDPLREQFAELESIGVTWLSIGLPAPSRSGYLEALAEFSETFIVPGR